MTVPISARVAPVRGRPTLLLNEVPEAPLLYALTDCPGARFTWEEVPARNIALFARQGIRLFQADVWFEQMLDAEGRLDITLARRQIAGILAQRPDAAVMLRLHVNPPPDWIRDHPDEGIGYSDTDPVDTARWGLRRPLDGDGGRPARASFSSRHWRAWAREHLAAFCRLLAATPEGDRLFSLQIANGLYGEWHQYGFMHHDPDTGPAATSAFRDWLGRQCPADADLQRRWNDPGASIARASCPDSAERETADETVVRDPRRRRRVIDYFTFLHEELLSVVVDLCGTAKRSWPRPLVTAAFFGYFYGVFGRNAAGGHLAVAEALASPDLDCLCSPQTYTEATRNPGGSGHSRGLLSVARRAGKLWLDEMDQATSVVGSPWDRRFRSTIGDDVAVMRRNVLHPVLRGAGQWWYDFGPTAGTPESAAFGLVGWWDHPRLQEEVGLLAALARSRLSRDYVSAADVLVVHDAWCFRHLLSRRIPLTGFEFGAPAPVGPDPFTHRAIEGLLEGLYHSGLVPEEALLPELAALDLRPFRLVILATTPVLDEAVRRLLRDRVANDGRHVVSLGFAGWGDGREVRPELGRELTGIHTEVAHPPTTESTVDLDGAVEVQRLDPGTTVPVFPADEGECIGRWTTGQSSARVLTGPGCTHWAFAVPPTSPAVLRALGRRAGCRIVNDADDVTLVGDGLVLIHTLTGGERTLRLPGGPVVRTILPARSTQVFDAVTGERLLS